jgi:hypothetical protein
MVLLLCRPDRHGRSWKQGNQIFFSWSDYLASPDEDQQLPEETDPNVKSV